MTRHCRSGHASDPEADATGSSCGESNDGLLSAESRPLTDGGTVDPARRTGAASTADGDAGDSGFLPIDVGAILVGLVSIVGGLAIGASSLQAAYHFSRFARAPVTELLREDPVAWVVLPLVLLLVWLAVGILLIVGRSRLAPLGAFVFLVAAAINVVVFVTAQTGMRPDLLWYVDPVSGILALPVNEILYRDVVQSELLGHAPGLVGTVVSLLFAGYFVVQSARRYVL